MKILHYRQRMRYIRNNSFNAISIWKIDEQADEMIIFQENTWIVSELQADAPRYHTRAMRINYLCICDLLLPKVKSSTLRRMLTGDISAASITNEAKVDERVRLALELGDPEITIDMEVVDLVNMISFGKLQLNFLQAKQQML